MTARRLWVTFCLCLVGLAGAVVAVQPTSRPDKWGILAVLAILAILPFQRGLWQRASRWAWAIVVAGLLLVFPAVVARGFGRVDMLSFLFHAEFGMEGATLKGLETEILQGVVACLLITGAAWLLARLWGLGQWAVLGLAAMVLALNPMLRFFVERALIPPVASDLATRMQVPAAGTGPTPDLVVIYLEGTDRQFADPAHWGDVYAPLQALADTGISFTAVDQIVGTGWSLAGMVASQCGVPVLPRGLISKNNFDQLATFMPGVTCLGDVLAARGYAMAYVVGGDLAFGGIGTFYATHGWEDRAGLQQVAAQFPQDQVTAATIDWILDDQMVFDAARTKVDQLLAGDAPMALVVETIGPHGATGYLSRACAPDGRGQKSKDVPAVLRCTIGDAVRFVADLRAAHAAARPDRDLRIVILSDHLSHNGRTPEPAPGYRRANTAIFLGGPEQGVVVAKPGAMIDIFPTMLEWTGLASGGAGIGRSLLGDDPTMVEMFGRDMLDRMLTDDAALAARLWAEL
jgi:phosphoglycerol transferase